MKLLAIFLIALTLISYAFADEKDVEFERAKKFFSKEAKKMDKWLGNWNEEWKDIFTEGPAYTGDGTTYGDPVTGGYCMMPDSEAYTKDMMFAAMNLPQYNISAGCGSCLILAQADKPDRVIRVRVVDRCGECPKGDIDLSNTAWKALTGDFIPSRVKIIWSIVPCTETWYDYPPLVEEGSPIKLKWKMASSVYWGGIQAYNTRYPVTSIERWDGNDWVHLRRDDMFHYMWDTTIPGGPMKVRVTQGDGVQVVVDGLTIDGTWYDVDDNYTIGTSQTTYIPERMTKTATATSSPTQVALCGDYPCCSKGAEVIYTDESGDWGLENGDWCFIKEDGEEPKEDEPDSSCWSAPYGYPCCKSCEIHTTNDSGKWGMENNKWCGIPDSCDGNTVQESCTGIEDGYPCCKTCNAIYNDEQGPWGYENNEWCGIKTSC
ncbi:hypothetical protein BCR32DRAFT_294235 [Anaeromyces robustus]|jgi:expansin (peptidoglycan-binding protein)|uniref:CBM10 domain-containing protein n=1 Tax=Anaeromyces robustus TaxID=1754192 RepID=A0A1Y1X2C7_9FUNG|nr:hypothetical protein BCR32DRAFT_294235 [Anaeromyces robustus]|eukprot:ORX79788.1 hypothetical protein BCR32DRAFT_294235 [Anaeromyces robustus]